MRVNDLIGERGNGRYFVGRARAMTHRYAIFFVLQDEIVQKIVAIAESSGR